jgi:3',5'-cyclic AMP phosphodiesterase CpdA
LFRLAHLSDPHLPPPPTMGRLRDLVSKRTLSRLSWRSKHLQHDPAVLAKLVADIQAYAPDHIALTGDLTNFSTPEEYAAARTWLTALAPPADLTVSPGNHDALVAEGQDERFASLAPWFGDGAEAAFPHVRRRGPIALVNLCSAVPTPPLFAGGRLGAGQIERLPQILDDLGRAGLVRVVMLHHPPVASVVSKRKALEDAGALRAVLLRHGAELVLHGHAHEAAFNTVAGPSGPIPVLGVPSASMPAGHHHPAARWHAIEIDATGLRIVARGLDAHSGLVGEVGRYALPAPISGTSA